MFEKLWGRLSLDKKIDLRVRECCNDFLQQWSNQQKISEAVIGPANQYAFDCFPGCNGGVIVQMRCTQVARKAVHERFSRDIYFFPDSCIGHVRVITTLRMRFVEHSLDRRQRISSNPPSQLPEIRSSALELPKLFDGRLRISSTQARVFTDDRAKVIRRHTQLSEIVQARHKFNRTEFYPVEIH